MTPRPLSSPRRGTVRHQGDVYDSTLAAIPFRLESVASRTLPGRGPVLELLGSIGGGHRDGGDGAGERDRGEDDGGAPAIFHGETRRAVAAACPLFSRPVHGTQTRRCAA